MTVALTVPALCAAYAVASGVAARRLVTRYRRVSPLGALAAGQKPTEVSFPSRDGRALISGRYLPAPFRRGAVVVVNCSASADNALSAGLSAVTQLVDGGLSVLQIGLRPPACSFEPPSACCEHEQLDVLGAIDWLRAQGYAARRIGVFGTAVGAVAAVRAAAAHAAVGAVVADSPFVDFGALLQRRFRQLSGLPSWLLPGTLWAARWLCGADLLRAPGTGELALLADRPVLVIQAAADPVTPLEQGREITRATGGVLWVTPSCRHLGSGIEEPALYGEVVSTFLVAHLLDEPVLDAPAANEGLVDWAESDGHGGPGAEVA